MAKKLNFRITTLVKAPIPKNKSNITNLITESKLFPEKIIATDDLQKEFPNAFVKKEKDTNPLAEDENIAASFYKMFPSDEKGNVKNASFKALLKKVNDHNHLDEEECLVAAFSKALIHWCPK